MLSIETVRAKRVNELQPNIAIDIVTPSLTGVIFQRFTVLMF